MNHADAHQKEPILNIYSAFKSGKHHLTDNNKKQEKWSRASRSRKERVRRGPGGWGGVRPSPGFGSVTKGSFAGTQTGLPES